MQATAASKVPPSLRPVGAMTVTVCPLAARALAASASWRLPPESLSELVAKRMEGTQDSRGGHGGGLRPGTARMVKAGPEVKGQAQDSAASLGECSAVIF